MAAVCYAFLNVAREGGNDFYISSAAKENEGGNSNSSEKDTSRDADVLVCWVTPPTHQQGGEQAAAHIIACMHSRSEYLTLWFTHVANNRVMCTSMVSDELAQMTCSECL